MMMLENSIKNYDSNIKVVKSIHEEVNYIGSKLACIKFKIDRKQIKN